MPAPPTAPDPALLAGLRKALASSEPRPLKGPGDAPLFPGGAAGGRLATAAVGQGLLTTEKVALPGKRTKVEVGTLTDKGRAFIAEADSPKAVLEALLPAVQALARDRDGPDPALFRAVVEKAAADCIAAVRAAFDEMGRAVVAAVASARPGPSADAAGVLGVLSAVLGRLGQEAKPAPAPAPAPPPTETAATPTAPATAPVPIPPTADALPAEEFRRRLRDAYSELKLYKEFRDGLVEIPRLYHEATKRIPGLGVERFHRELEALSQERKAELHKLNEVQSAKERHLAIERNDRLYYYILWE